MSLARRRLVGHDYLAEDVVSRAIVKWSQLGPEQREVGRLEQVVKSEALSILRSERRARARDTRASTDAALVAAHVYERNHYDLDAAQFQETYRSLLEGSKLTERDVRVLQLLLAGYSLSEAASSLGIARHTVRNSRNRIRRNIEQLREGIL